MRATVMQKANRNSGFTLIELMVSVALGLLVMAALGTLFKSGMDATLVVTQRAELQQNMRAAIELLSKDIGMAGLGPPAGGIQIPSRAGFPGLKKRFGSGGKCPRPALPKSEREL